MKKLSLLASLILGLVSVHAQTLEQTMYIDFGANAGTNGAITPSPDVNNHYWNTPIDGTLGATWNIVNSENTDTGYDIEVTNNFIVNTSVNYGPTAPSSTLLGDLALATATQDYWYLETAASGNNTGQVTFKNLDPAKLYKFQVFASRPTTNTRITSFVFNGLTTFSGQVQTSNGTTGNLDTLLVTTMLSPTAAGDITLDVAIIQNGYGYMNIVKIEEYSVTAVDAPVAAATQSFCSGSSPMVSSLIAAGVAGSTLNWYDAPVAGNLLTPTTALTAGMYYVSQTIDGTESSRAAVTVVINTTPATPVITPQGSLAVCEGSSVILASDVPTGTATYQWYKDGVIISGAVSQNYTATTAGMYTVSVLSTNACASAVSTGAVVTVNALPVVAAITGNNPVAVGATVQLASATTGGVWSTDNAAVATVTTNGLVTGVTAGIANIAYTVTSAGCSATVTTTVTVTNGEILQQTMYIDFGPNTGTNGAVTPGPDVNGHYWNNPVSGTVGSSTAIVNANNAATGYNMVVTDNFVINTTTNYGPTVTNASLGDLGIATATQDYFYLETGGTANTTGQLTFSNLNPAKGYKFHVFASRPTTTIRKTAFAFAGLNSFSGEVQTSNGGTGNIDTVLATSVLSPTTDGEITLNVSIAQDAYGYLNLIKIEEYSNLPITAVTSVTVTGNDISVSGQPSQLTATVLPANATFGNVAWSVDNPAVAVISQTGILTPVSNGTVVVTATSAQNPDAFGTKTITVTNQNTTLFFSGSATENGANVATALPMHMVTGTNGAVSNIFEIYTSLNEAGTFNFYTSQGNTATVYGAGATAGSLLAAGAGIDPTPTGPVLIIVNLTTNTYTITPINWSVVGSSIVNGWSGDAPLAYQGNGVWQATLDMTVVGTDTNPRFVFKANQNWDYTMKKVTGSQHSVAMESQANEFGITLQDIDLKYGNFLITLNLNNYTYGIECTDIDDYKISFMGSSVMNGFGATNMEGYAYKYNNLLAERATQGSSAFYRSNVSVNGNNTVAVLNRFEKDLIGDCSSYVIFGLALGNEGIHENGQAAYDQYLANMPLLIQMARDAGKTPLVMTNYVRGDFNAADYAYVKQMNLLMEQWDVPSINMLGATDNGTGNWVEGYWYDALHPNDLGHTELFYAIVPSLFDALEAEKPQPVLSTTSYITPDPVSGGGSLAFTPDNKIHPFTVSFDVQTSATGNLMAFTTYDTTTGSIAIDANGFVTYTSPAGTTITGTTAVNDGAWHKVTLTHFYARGETVLYTDATVSGTVAEQLDAKVFSLHGSGAPANINYRNWFFYRSGMNALEIEGLNQGKMLKSSLELYAPLNHEAGANGMFANLAQSTNTINAANFTLGTTNVVAVNNSFKAYPNPVKDVLTISAGNNVTVDKIEVYNTLGMLVTAVNNAQAISLGKLQAGMYLVKVYAGNTASTVKIVKE